MWRKLKITLALAFSFLLTTAASAQSVTINGRPLVSNPRQQINSAQANRVFGGLSIAVHTVPPAGQPAFLAGNPVVAQQMNAAVQANRNYDSRNPNSSAFEQPTPVGDFTGIVYNAPFATQGWIAAANAPNVPLRPLTPAEYNRLFGGLNQGTSILSPSSPPAGIPAEPPIR